MSVSLVPTFECIGVTATKQTGVTRLEYRVLGMTQWKPAHQMVDTKDGFKRGSIFWLTPRVNYEVQVTYPDSMVEIEITQTRDDNPPCVGRSIYVAANGNDSNNGDIATPIKTLTKVISMMQGGDHFYFRGGSYAGGIINKSGQAANWVVLEGYQGETVNFTSGVQVRGSNIRIIRLNSSGAFPSYNFEFTGEYGDVVQDCIIEYCNLANSGTTSYSSCIGIFKGAGRILVHHNVMTVTGNSSGDVEDKNGVYWWEPGDSCVFHHNTVNGMPWDGFGGGPEHVTTTCNNFDFYENTVVEAWDDGVQPEGGLVNTRCWRNRIEGSMLGFTTSCPESIGPIYIFRNQVWANLNKRGDGNDGLLGAGHGGEAITFLYHNSYWGMAGSVGIYAKDYGAFNVISRNNIVYCDRYAVEFGHLTDGTGCDFDYDIISHRNSGYNRIKWGDGATKAVGSSVPNPWDDQEAHGYADIDPMFVNGPGGDFNLQAGSPAIDKGAVLVQFNDENSPWPFKGSAPDIGAVEYDGGGGPVPVPPVASFTASPAGGVTPLTVQFADRSTGVITSWAWTFGDGQTSTAQNPSHVYATAGSYSPSLRVTGPDGTSSATVATPIVVNAPNPPTAVLAATPSSGNAPLSVIFRNNSTNSTSGTLNYGDGSASVSLAPGAQVTKVYNAVGSYIAVLSVTGPGGSASAQVTIAVSQTTIRLTIASVGNGTTDPAPGPHDLAPGTVKVSAIPAANNYFVGWTTPSGTDTRNPLPVVLGAPITITATFAQIPTPPQPTPTHNVTISTSAGGTTNPAPNTYTVNEGQRVYVTAIPEEDFVFDHWEGSLSGSNASGYFDVLADMNIKAVFAAVVPPMPIMHTLTMNNAVGGDTDPGFGTHTIEQGFIVLDASPGANYMFSKWVINGMDVTTNPYRMYLAEATDVTPVFSLVAPPSETVVLTLSAKINGETVPPAGVYLVTKDQGVDISTIPQSGYEFDHWEGDETGTVPTIHVVMSASKSISAVFKIASIQPTPIDLNAMASAMIVTAFGAIMVKSAMV